MSSRTGRSRHHQARRDASGQSTVELAVILPVVVMLVLLAIQVSLVMRDRMLLVTGTRAAARAAIVSPDVASAGAVLRRHGGALESAQVSFTGDPRPGGLLTVSTQMRPTTLPVVGRVVSKVVLHENLTVLVEGTR